MHRRLELSNQQFASGEFTTKTPLDHLPLTDLESIAPDLSGFSYDRERVWNAFSNDECTAPYFEQLVARTETPEYQGAQNRVAVIIGESSLASNLRYIPEETIIWVDNSADKCIYHGEYLAGLREDSGPDEWYDRLQAVGPSGILDSLRYQVVQWEKAGRTPLLDQNSFDQAQRYARQKAIIPWHADVRSADDMIALGSILQEHNALITMMNLTNVLSYIRMEDPRSCAALFRDLPLTPNAPILTSYNRMKPEERVLAYIKGFPLNFVTGPFFGLQNLANAETAHTVHGLGAIVARNVYPPVDGRVTDEELRILEGIEAAMAQGGGAYGDFNIVMPNQARPDDPPSDEG